MHFINRKSILRDLDLAREVGKYILDYFFDGDFQSFTNPSSTKERRFRALLAREDLLLGKTTIYNFVRVSHQLEQLPPDVVDSLSLAQHRALLPLPDPERKEELARRALAEGWTSPVLAKQVSELLPKSRRGGKPSPPFAKAIRGVAKALAAPHATPTRSVAWGGRGPWLWPPSFRTAWTVSKPSRRHSTRRAPSTLAKNDPLVLV